MAHNVASTLFDIGRNKAKAKLRGRRKTNDRRSSSKGSRLSSGEAGRGVTLSRSGFWTGDDVASLSKGMAAEVQKMAEDEAVEAQQSSFVFPPDANEPNLKTNKMLLKSRSALMATLTLGGRDAQSFSVSNPLASKLSLARSRGEGLFTREDLIVHIHGILYAGSIGSLDFDTKVKVPDVLVRREHPVRTLLARTPRRAL